MTDRFDAVEVDGNNVKLEITYSTGDYSDSNLFQSGFGGARGLETLQEAKADVVSQARAWVNGLRADGHDVGAWDATGNSY